MTDCDCKTFTTHTTHGDPWCQCGHQYGRHAASGACTYTEEPTLAASEVKVLTETASKVAYALGRKDAGEETAKAIETELDETDDLPGLYVTGMNRARWIALETASLPPGATSDATSGVPGHPEVSEAVRSPQEPCGHPTCPCAEGNTP